MDIRLRGGQPSSQYSTEFLQGMIDRCLTSFPKYGHVKDSIDKGMDPVAEIRERLRNYASTGNTEWLMDVGNYAMFEFMFPSHDNAHFDPTAESKGRRMRDGTMSLKHADQMGGDL